MRLTCFGRSNSPGWDSFLDARRFCFACLFEVYIILRCPFEVHLVYSNYDNKQ